MGAEKPNRANASKEGMAEQHAQGRENEIRDGDIVISAIRHIGPTLESDPEYYAVAAPGYSTPEAQIAAEAVPIDAGQGQIQEENFDVPAAYALDDHPEKLRTRLPGDESSDPHTDLRPENAANLQESKDVRQER